MTLDVSVLVPAKDEAPNLPEFVARCADALGPAGFSFEVVVVDDGSRDETPRVLCELRAKYPFLHVVTHRRQRGIADALRSGVEASRGEVCVFYPADLQYLPEDIPPLVRPILDDRADIVTGTKQGKYEKAFVSSIYNALCRALFGVGVTDLNSVKAWRRGVMAGAALRPDWHRYMVVIAATDGFRLASHPVRLYPRMAGVSKFNWRRIPVGVLDLLSVWFQLRFGRKPMLFFGVVGAVLFAIGFLVGVAALILRFGYGIGFRPFLNLVETMVISGIVLFGFGFVGEMIAGMREEQRELARELAGELARESIGADAADAPDRPAARPPERRTARPPDRPTAGPP
ncbi:MAG TPA: DPM/DPG synthase family glycosyltransferase [Gemmatimonadales bacterium]|nr:DPM/DPG synthase family glycosyltransferase [Gemmatimonadales bacterium]